MNDDDIIKRKDEEILRLKDKLEKQSILYYPPSIPANCNEYDKTKFFDYVVNYDVEG